MSIDDASLPISLIAHTAFCPRRAWLEAAGEHVESRAIDHGLAAHQAVDARVGDRAARRRSVDVRSVALGVHGRCDVVDVDGGRVRVVEFKSSPMRRSSVVTPAQRAQLALQGICLREAGFEVTGHGVFFTTTRRAVDVTITEADEEEAHRLVAQTREVVEAAAAPPPLVDDPRCGRCSHAGICLPDERAEEPVHRRIRVADRDGEVLHLTTPGSRASLRAGRVLVVRGEENLGDVPVDRVQGVVVHGNVDVSTGLLRELLWRSVSVVWCSGRGTVVGYAGSAASPNGQARGQQRFAAEGGDIALARELVASKISNQATFLRRGARRDVSGTVAEMRRLARRAGTAGSVGEILGWEGAAAALYFRDFPLLLAATAPAGFAASWRSRSGRGAVDPINVALNYAYGILLGEVVRAVLACGLDPHAGFVHSSSRNKPALALDLMEQFRPVIADSVVLGLINNGELKESMFTEALGSWRLRDEGRRAIVKGYERRVEQEFTHPIFRYKVTWRRAMEIQARMVLGVLDGTQPKYVGLRVR